MLLSVPSKIICRIILDRMQQPLDEIFRREQAVFQKNNCCTNHIASYILQSMIASLRIIVAFDSLDRNILWKLLRNYAFSVRSR